jgi:hypothetical protein
MVGHVQDIMLGRLMSRVTVSPDLSISKLIQLVYRHRFNKPRELDKSRRQIDASAILYPNNGPKRGSYGNVFLLLCLRSS